MNVGFSSISNALNYSKSQSQPQQSVETTGTIAFSTSAETAGSIASSAPSTSCSSSFSCVA